MDFFFSRFSHPHMSVEEGILFNGNVVDSKGKPFHIELFIPSHDSKKPLLCELSITSSNSSWFAVSSKEYKLSYQLRKENPFRKDSFSKFTQFLSAVIIIYFDFGTFEININDTMVSIIEHLDILS